MIDEVFSFKGKVEIFPMENPWHYIRVPKKYSDLTEDFADRGLVPITAKVGKTEWQTSLLPYGDGSKFIALKAAVRKAEDITLGDTISIEFWLRDR